MEHIRGPDLATIWVEQKVQAEKPMEATGVHTCKNAETGSSTLKLAAAADFTAMLELIETAKDQARTTISPQRTPVNPTRPTPGDTAATRAHSKGARTLRRTRERSETADHADSTPINATLEQTGAPVSQPTIERTLLRSSADENGSAPRRPATLVRLAETDGPRRMPARDLTDAEVDPAGRELSVPTADGAAWAKSMRPSVQDDQAGPAAGTPATSSPNQDRPGPTSAGDRDRCPIAPAGEPTSGHQSDHKQVETVVASGTRDGDAAASTLHDGQAASDGASPQPAVVLMSEGAEGRRTVSTGETPGTSATPRTTGNATSVPSLREEDVVPVSVLQTRAAEPEIAVRLTLAHLGTVEVRIANSDDPSAAVRINTDRTQTLHTMIADQAQLQAVLQQSGVGREGRTIEYGLLVHATLDGANAAADQHGERGRGDEPNRQAAGTHDDELELDGAPLPGRPGATRASATIDITA